MPDIPRAIVTTITAETLGMQVAIAAVVMAAAGGGD
jgi:hypothetical protein